MKVLLETWRTAPGLLAIPPPQSAEFPEKTAPETDSVPKLLMPPPYVVLGPVRVRPETVAEAPLSTVRMPLGVIRGELNCTVSLPAPGPTTFMLALTSGRELFNEIVPVTPNWTVLPELLSARVMQ